MIDFSNQWDIPTETILPYVYIQNKCLTSLSQLTRLRLSHTLEMVQITTPTYLPNYPHQRKYPKKAYREYGATEAGSYVSSHACSKLLAPSDRAINISDSIHNDIPRRTQSPLIAIKLLLYCTSIDRPPNRLDLTTLMEDTITTQMARLWS